LRWPPSHACRAVAEWPANVFTVAGAVTELPKGAPSSRLVIPDEQESLTCQVRTIRYAINTVATTISFGIGRKEGICHLSKRAPKNIGPVLLIPEAYDRHTGSSQARSATNRNFFNRVRVRLLQPDI